ncbi:MAG: hypothetical protein ACR2H5_25640 [Ktedonobacteraceae bacterium]
MTELMWDGKYKDGKKSPRYASSSPSRPWKPSTKPPSNANLPSICSMLGKRQNGATASSGATKNMCYLAYCLNLLVK